MVKVKALRTIYTGGHLRKKGSEFDVSERTFKKLTAGKKKKGKPQLVKKVDKGFKNRQTKQQQELSELTVAALTDLAKEIGLKGYSTMNKAELIEALKNKL